ncbi:unnamed protein product [Zymoseptoria tritici ST99CH_3D7]|uniref:AMP-dependent synthetase/ligase domain-containing protein n=1 Tax=Zymoseptoria tritici (strain ST99CH_3D7) TaxID=1276538 RepID=A0A1X7S1P8_ZYMT9|nr:unnamed protein product [Zymoseptoria tritici ST99CH_3D7]
MLSKVKRCFTSTTPSRRPPHISGRWACTGPFSSASSFLLRPPSSSSSKNFKATLETEATNPNRQSNQIQPSQQARFVVSSKNQISHSHQAPAPRQRPSRLEPHDRLNTTIELDNMPTPCPNIVSFALSGDYDETRPILIDAANPARSINKARAIQLIASLTGAFKPGSTVVLHLTNDITYPILYMAILASGCRWVGSNTTYTASELEHIFNTSKADYIITDQEHLETIRAAVGNSGTLAEMILFADILENPHAECLPSASSPLDCGAKNGESLASSGLDLHRTDSFNFRTLYDLQHDGTPVELFAALETIDIDSTAVMMSTSGTTGMPKIATRTHRAMVLEAINIEDNNAAKPYPVRRLFCTPIFHGFSAPEMLINSLRLGLTNFFMKRFNPVVFPENVYKYGITEIFAPPAMLALIVNRPESHALVQTLEAVYTGGAILMPELRRQFLALFTTPPIVFVVYGMTEGGWFSVSKYPHNDNTNSVGHVVPGTEVKVLHSGEHASTLTDGTAIGLILVKSEHLMTGYESNPQATAEHFHEDGWLNTGDIGYLRDGKIYLVDRAKDLIKVNGWQVAPAEIEDALLMSADVKDAGVIGVGEGLEEHPLAFVVRTHEGVTEEGLKKHLLTRLTKYKVMSTRVEFIDAIPKSISGKILKKDLRKMMADRKEAGLGLC